MTHYDECFKLVIGSEGGYVNDARDPGGETNWGISKRAYPKLNIAGLTLEDAKVIYKRDYWDAVSADHLGRALAYAAFDTAVNQGVGAARGYLQSTQDWREFLSRRLLDYTDMSLWFTYSRGWTKRLAHVLAACAGFEKEGPAIKRVFVNGKELRVGRKTQVGEKLYINTEG